MKLFSRIALGLVFAAAVLPSQTPAAPIRWRIVPTSYCTADVVIAGCTVREFGARGDGATDDTEAFQAAMKAMADAGGGTVFVPEGRYTVKGNLSVPTTVTLRGERDAAASGRAVRGAILMAYAGRGQTDGKPFLTLKSNAGLKDLSIWYPQQDPAHIKPYPFTIQFGEIATIEGLTLVNSYQGINDPVGSTFVIRNVAGTPLATGIQIDNCYDTGRIENLEFSPDVWSRSGLPGAPAADGPHRPWMLTHGTAIRYFRIDWQCAAFVRIDGYHTGVEMVAAKAGPSYGHFYGSDISHCTIAVSAVTARFPGFLFTHCLLDGDDRAVVAAAEFDSFLGFHSCTIRGRNKAVDLPGKPAMAALFQQCVFQGEVALAAGDFSLLGCTFRSAATHVTIGPSVRAGTIAGAQFDGPARIVNRSPSRHVKISDQRLPPSKIPTVAQSDERALKPGRAMLYVVTDAAWGAKMDGRSDDTAAIQRAMDAAAQDGGGLVFLPAGEYAVRGHLTVPSGVELRGIYDISHHCFAKGSALRIYAGENDERAAPAIVMQRKSGIRGLTFLYPRQRYDRIVPFPYTIQGRGADIYVVNITAINSYKILDFMTCRCDRHYLDRVYGAPLRVGIAVGGGSVGGEVRNTNLNPGWWTLSPYPDCPGTPDIHQALNGDLKKNPVAKYVTENLDAMIYGDCTNELEFAAAICPERYGIHFVTQNGRGAAGVFLAHASDSAEVTALFEGLAPAGVDFININLASYNPAEKRYCGDDIRSEARFYNVATWGVPDYSAVVKSGTLLFELAHFNQYAPFVINGGRLALTNVLLSRSFLAGKELLVKNGGQVALTGNITAHGMRWNADAPAGAVTARFETEHAFPARATGAEPVGAWMLDEGQGTIAADRTGKGHPGTIQNAQWTSGAWGTALAFDGKGNSQLAINTRGMPEFKAITVEAWVCPTQLGTMQGLVSWEHRLSLRINEQREANHFACFLPLANGSMEPRASGPVAQVNVWQHVAAVWDGDYLQLWVNGQRHAEAERSGPQLPADGPILVGRGLRGMMRGLRLYDRPLAEEEIRAHGERK